MPNYQYACEWLDFARKHLETANLLFRENHYTDIIAYELHQTIEKAFKAVLAYNAVKLIRTHNLMELHKECCKYLDLSTIDLDTLIEINDYYENERYPGPKYTLPTMDEIDRNVKLCDDIYTLILRYLHKKD